LRNPQTFTLTQGAYGEWLNVNPDDVLCVMYLMQIAVEFQSKGKTPAFSEIDV